MLFEFALAEQATFLDMHAAAALTESPARCAAYLRHALDEGRHALLFANQSEELRARRRLPPVGSLRQADIEYLYEQLGEVRFLAFVHLGERRACEKFEVIQRWLDRHEGGVLVGALKGILRDEERHTSYTYELLVELAGSERLARRHVRDAALLYAWRSWRRWGKGLAELVYGLLMLVVYLLVAPLALLVRVVRPTTAAWQRPS